MNWEWLLYDSFQKNNYSVKSSEKILIKPNSIIFCFGHNKDSLKEKNITFFRML